MNILSSKCAQFRRADKTRWRTHTSRLTPAMALKHGYSSVEEYKKGAQKKFSLLETGIIQKPSTRLLLINVSSALARNSSPIEV